MSPQGVAPTRIWNKWHSAGKVTVDQFGTVTEGLKKEAAAREIHIWQVSFDERDWIVRVARKQGAAYITEQTLIRKDGTSDRRYILDPGKIRVHSEAFHPLRPKGSRYVR